MNKHRSKQFLCVVLCLLLAAAVCGLSGCGNEATVPTAAVQTSATADTVTAQAVEFTFVMTDIDGNSKATQVTTDCKTVGAALLDGGMIDGEESEYGLYVKTVLGQTYDYDTDGVYWAFYINGEYGLTGVDTTEIVPGSVYEFRAER